MSEPRFELLRILLCGVVCLWLLYGSENYFTFTNTWQKLMKKKVIVNRVLGIVTLRTALCSNSKLSRFTKFDLILIVIEDC